MKSEEDIENGRRLRYYPNGKILEVAEYVDGDMDGVCKAYDEDGNVMSESVYKKNQIVGDKISYHKNGTIAMIAPHKNGKANGVTKKYSETGDLLEEWIFEDGQLKGKKDYTLKDL